MAVFRLMVPPQVKPTGDSDSKWHLSDQTAGTPLLPIAQFYSQGENALWWAFLTLMKAHSAHPPPYAGQHFCVAMNHQSDSLLSRPEASQRALVYSSSSSYDANAFSVVQKKEKKTKNKQNNQPNKKKPPCKPVGSIGAASLTHHMVHILLRWISLIERRRNQPQTSLI